MKKLMLAVCLMFGGATLVSAQDQQDQSATQSQTETQTPQDREGQQISVSELPDAVTAQLESPDYSGWTVGTAHKKMDDQQNEIYVVELRQGTETKKVKFDRDGNKMEGKDKDKSQNYRDESKDASSTEDATQQDATDQADNTETQPDQK